MVVHVGDPGTAALTVTNSTLADGYSENLIAAITGATGNVQIGATGPTGQIQPGASDTSSLTLNFSTAQAALIPTTVTVALTSDGGLGTGSIDGLGQLALAPQAVPLNIAVNNFAQAAWVKLSGGGTFSQNGLNYTLDLGSFVHNAPAVTVNLGALNPAAGPADLLSGTFQIAGSNALSTAGFGAFSGFGAGQQNGVGTLTLQTGTPGIFSKTITLHPTGSNASGFSAPLADETLTISAIVFASAPSIAVGADHATTTDIGGFAPPGSTVQLFENGVLTPVATGVTGADSGFNLPMPRFADGPHFLTATSTDGVSPSLFSSPATVVVQNSGTSAAQIHTDISFTLAADERYLTLMGNASLTGIGNALDNIIYGNSAPNVLAAGAGNDLIVSRSGRDTIDGGPGFNSVSWTELSQAVDIDLANPANSDSAVTNVQVFTLTNSADTFVGAGSPVFVYGLDGDDDIKGSTSGGDFIVPGRGHNTIDGGGGEFDVISFQDRTTGVHIDLSNPANSDAVITGVNDFHLTNQDDTFIAGATTVYVYAFGGHDHIIGSPQSDFIDPGRDGGTTVEGGGGFDYVSFFTAPAGITLNLADPTQNTGAAIGDVFHNIGEFILTPHDDTFIGLTSGQNIVLDYSGNNHILGGLNANNLLFSGPGNDFLQGGILGDTLSGGAGNDTYAFGTLKPAASFPNAHLYAASILDFVSGEDKFQFDDTAFGIAAGTSFVEGSTFVTGTLSSQPANTTTAPTLLYYTDAGLLYFDPDGTGSQEVHLLAQILGAPTLHGSDFVTL
jgi:Ca2+-binding RTX toxin-like protein